MMKYSNPTPILTLKHPASGVVTFSLTYSGNNPTHIQWYGIITQVVQRAFEGRAVAFVLPDPPLAWGDLDLNEVTTHCTTLTTGNAAYTVGFAPDGNRSALAMIAESEDFLHGGVHIAALSAQSESRVQGFVTTLHTTTAHYPAWETYLQLPAVEIEKLLQQEIVAKASSGEELMECDQDADVLYWYNPATDALIRVREALQQSATAYGWQLTES